MKTCATKIIISILLMFVFLVGCENEEIIPEFKVEHRVEKIMEDTIYETEVYYFETNKEGPRVAIVGGIHGDETAGWRAGLLLLEYEYTQGSIMVIPRASVLAIALNQRYPGISTSGVYQGVTYKDLNRQFPGNANGTTTEQLAFAIMEKVIAFEPEYVIDLHEARKSYRDGYLGDSVIYSNVVSALFALEVVEAMNEQYLELGDVPFRVDNSAPVGSFNHYCSICLNVITLTFETNRELALDKRIQQQMDLLNVFFNKIWTN